jgi:prepilin-type N-terminal cleavage/methylation domain-containing protein
MKTSSHTRPTGLTLTEVLIALLLLSIAFTAIITVFRSATLESAFTVEHYTAMFLAQKILEDINARVRHNPHTFTDLIAKGIGTPEPVVEGRSRYFRLLENTNNYGYLSEADDEPIREGPLFEQLKGFPPRCRPTSRAIRSPAKPAPI